MAANALNTIYRFAIPLAAGFGLAQASLYDVKGGNRAIIFDRLSGVREGVVNEGTHFLIPWLQKAIVYDVRTKPRNISTTTGSKDLQMVSLTLRVLHRPEVSKLSTIYQVCGVPYCDSNSGNDTNRRYRTSAKTTTSVSFPPSETKSSKPSSHNSMPPSLLPSVKPSQIASAPSS
jgi:regulator of protease activity HflC (stomatin/prohibitin superfamily)